MADSTRDADDIRWTSWPLRDEPWAKSALLLAVMLATGVLAAMQYLLLGPLAVLLIFVLMGPYFLPTRYEVSAGGVKKFFFMFNRDRPWNVYKRFVVQKDGVFLSPFPRPSRLDSYRGDFLRFTPKTDRDRVLALVKKNVPSQ